ncbi:hypothetical protein [[Actinomadura] parvosata]|uniref:hypothetical protein n=1 Tax=[Actinomadura] parvosata TaxID=1955412 RepID=UPI0012BD2987|nr:hypothetical protein [Nonomuraea sp. ATCC 55076]
MSHALSSVRPKTASGHRFGRHFGEADTTSPAMTTHSPVRLDDLPDGTVKIPLELPHGAAWPVAVQVAALSQRQAGCTASIGYLARRLRVHPSTIYHGLAAAGGWIVTDSSTSVTRRFLAPIPQNAAWARISYRAAAGVGCHRVGGVWAPRRNRAALLELYCRLRCDEEVGRVREQAALAEDLGVTDRTVRSLLATLESDGWITGHRVGRLIAYRTHDAPLRVANSGPGVRDEGGGCTMFAADEQSRKAGRDDLGSRGEMISEAEPAQKPDDQAGGRKRDGLPLAVGALQHRRSAEDGSLPERAQIGGVDGQAMERLPRPAMRPGGALSVMCALPLGWQARMSETERERVLTAIETELRKGRTAAELSARVRRRLTVWRGLPVRRPVAAALTVVRRGYHCPRPECEDHVLPSGHACLACVSIGAQVNEARRAPVASSAVPGPGDRPTWPPKPVPSPPPFRAGLPDDFADARRRGAALARRTLEAWRLPTVDKLTPSGQGIHSGR